jgi:hypothetical protein
VEKKQRWTLALVHHRQADIAHIDAFHIVCPWNWESLLHADLGFIIGR